MIRESQLGFHYFLFFLCFIILFFNISNSFIMMELIVSNSMHHILINVSTFFYYVLYKRDKSRNWQMI